MLVFLAGPGNASYVVFLSTKSLDRKALLALLRAGTCSNQATGKLDSTGSDKRAAQSASSQASLQPVRRLGGAQAQAYNIIYIYIYMYESASILPSFTLCRSVSCTCIYIYIYIYYAIWCIYINITPHAS